MQTPVIINLNHLLFMLIFYNIFSFDSSKIAFLHREFSLNFTTGVITTAFWVLKICYALKKKRQTMETLFQQTKKGKTELRSHKK